MVNACPLIKNVTPVFSQGTSSLEIKTTTDVGKIMNLEGYLDGTTYPAVEIDCDTNSTTTGCRGGALFIELDRPTTNILASWDGNPDTGLKMTINNRANNTTSSGGTRAIDAYARNRGAGHAWVNGMLLNARNDSGCECPEVISAKFQVENYGTIATTAIGVDINMLNEGAVATDETALRIRNTNASLATACVSAIQVTKGATNLGFDYVIDTSGADAINTAVMRLYDDGTVCNDTNATGSQTMAGYLTVVVGSATRYIWLASNAPTA